MCFSVDITIDLLFCCLSVIAYWPVWADQQWITKSSEQRTFTTVLQLKVVRICWQKLNTPPINIFVYVYKRCDIKAAWLSYPWNGSFTYTNSQWSMVIYCHSGLISAYWGENNRRTEIMRPLLRIHLSLSPVPPWLLLLRLARFHCHFIHISHFGERYSKR